MSVMSQLLGRRMGLVEPESTSVLVEKSLTIPMDDGVELLADRYAPAGWASGPTVLVRSPYGRDGFVGLIFGRMLAERGLQSLCVSVRGTGGSPGRFSPFDERADGLATLRWLRAQPWHSGGVGGTGPSYLGLTQWAIADELDVLTPTVTASQFHGQAYGGGSVSLQTALSWIAVLGVGSGPLAPVKMIRLLRDLPFDELPLGELDRRATGRALDFYGEWFENPLADSDYWTSRDFSGSVASVTAPAQFVGGWQDIFLPWMLDDYAALSGAGRSPQLIVGPWTHTSPALAARQLEENVAWLRAGLLGDDRRVSPAAVSLWVGGGVGWRSYSSWPPVGAADETWSLGGDGMLVPGADAVAGERSFVYDPSHATPSVGGPSLFEQRPVRDNRSLEARDDVLVWTSATLASDLDVIGPVGVSLEVRSSLPAFDVFARLCDVDASGESLNVCDALLRCTSDSATDSVRVEFRLWPTAHRFRAGHRLRLQVSGGAHPRYARNPGTGEPDATATRLVAGSRTVVCGPESTLTLSVVPQA